SKSPTRSPELAALAGRSGAVTSAREAARERYVADYHHFEVAAAQMEGLLQRVCSDAGVRAEVNARAKTISSFVKKMHVREYEDPWKETTDKVGARVIVETL